MNAARSTALAGDRGARRCRSAIERNARLAPTAATRFRAQATVQIDVIARVRWGIVLVRRARQRRPAGADEERPDVANQADPAGPLDVGARERVLEQVQRFSKPLERLTPRRRQHRAPVQPGEAQLDQAQRPRHRKCRRRPQRMSRLCRRLQRLERRARKIPVAATAAIGPDDAVADGRLVPPRSTAVRAWRGASGSRVLPCCRCPGSASPA